MARAIELFKRAANHPNAEEADILDAVDNMVKLGFEDKDRAAAWYEKAAENARTYYIYKAADGIAKLGDAYVARAIELFKRAANHPNAEEADILEAVDRMIKLGFEDKDRAAAWYEKAAENARTIRFIFKTADGMAKLGPEYADRAVTWYERVANQPRASADNILDAANGIRKLGEMYLGRRAEFNARSAELLKSKGLERPQS